MILLALNINGLYESITFLVQVVEKIGSTTQHCVKQTIKIETGQAETMFLIFFFNYYLFFNYSPEFTFHWRIVGTVSSVPLALTVDSYNNDCARV